MTSEYYGQFVWYELMTSDPDAAEAFYRDVMGWRTEDAGIPDRRYTMLNAGDMAVGGLMTLPDKSGLKPVWLGYIAVDDVDAETERVTAAGGAVHHPAEDIPGIGRFAMVSDPQGAAFILFRAKEGIHEPPQPGAPGHPGWRELRTRDPKAGFDFYSLAFGWTKDQSYDMGPAGPYQTFAAGAEPIGGVMAQPEGTGRPRWLYFFNVAGIDAAIDRVVAGGGRTLTGAHEVPGGGWIAHCEDPQGAMFGLLAPAR